MVTKRKHPMEADNISASLSASSFRKAIKTLELARKGAGFATVPILTCLVIVADADGVRAEYRGTDISVSVDVEGTGSGCIVLPARPLRAFLSGVTSETVEIVKSQGESRATLSSGYLTLKIVPMNVADTPVRDIPKTVEREFALAEGVLSSLMRFTIPFISTEETRYYLNGVCLAVDSGVLVSVATDGHKLAKRQTTLGTPVADLDPIIVPRSICILALAAMAGAEVDVQVFKKAVRFSGKGVSIYADLIDGTFPDWRRVVPDVGGNTFTFDGRDAGRFLTSAMTMTKNRHRAVSLTAEGRAVSLSFAAAHDDIEEFSSVIEAKTVGLPQRIGLDGSYLVAIIRALGGGLITIDQSERGGDKSSYPGPVRISSTTGQDGDLVVLMPMRI